MPPPTKRSTLQIYLDPAFRRTFRRRAVDLDTTASALARRALAAYLTQLSREQEPGESRSDRARSLIEPAR